MTGPLPVMPLAIAAIALPIAAPAADAWITYEGGAGPGDGRRIVLISGDEEYRSEEALPQLAAILAKRHGFTCTTLFAVDPETGFIDPANQRSIPGLEHLASADLMIIATRFRNLPDGQMRHVDDYLRSGRPVVGMRTATHAFALDEGSAYARYSWNAADEGFEEGFGRQVLGETWVAHHGDHGRESTLGVAAPGAAAHPILRGIEDGGVWGPTDVYRVRLPLSGDATPILLGQVLAGMSRDDDPVEGAKNDPLMPIAWTRTYEIEPGRRGRVFTTTMGAATDLACEGTRRLLIHGVYWAVGLEERIPPQGADVAIVGEYEPSDFGFGGHRRGVRPADHALPGGAAEDRP